MREYVPPPLNLSPIDSLKRELREAFLNFLADSGVEDTGDSETGNYYSASEALHIEELAKLCGFSSAATALQELDDSDKEVW